MTRAIRLCFVATVLLPLCSVAANPDPGSARAPAPDAHCLDARSLESARRLDDGRLLVATARGGHLLRLQAGCPVDLDAPDLSLLGPDGWVCGDGSARLRGGADGCLVASVEPVPAREFADLARRGDAALMRTATALDAVEVQARAPRRRGFPASFAYCLPIRHVRGFSVNDDGVRIEVSPHRADGNRWYQVDLQRSCPELEATAEINIESGMGIGLLCGNAGDRLVPRVNGLFDGPSLSRDCPVAAVYPVDG